MNKTPIYTIGYGNRNITDFISILTKYNIQYLVDVRTNPMSSYDPSYKKE
ncbi:DUF488 family protein [Geobacillus zalihae]|nr:DUF488 family protein [Geobacillus zalihae]